MSPIYRCTCGQTVHDRGPVGRVTQCPNCGRPFSGYYRPQQLAVDQRRSPWWITCGLLAGLLAVGVDYLIGKEVLIGDFSHWRYALITYGVVGLAAGIVCRVLNRCFRIGTLAILFGAAAGLLTGVALVVIDGSAREWLVVLYTFFGLLLAALGGSLLRKPGVLRALLCLAVAGLFGFFVFTICTTDWEQTAEQVVSPDAPAPPPPPAPAPPRPEMPVMEEVPRPEIVDKLPNIVEAVPASEGVSGDHRVYHATLPEDGTMELSIMFSKIRAVDGRWGHSGAEVTLDGAASGTHPAKVLYGTEGIHWLDRLPDKGEDVSPQIRCSFPVSESDCLHREITVWATVNVVYAKRRSGFTFWPGFDNKETTLSQSFSLLIVTPDDVQRARQYAGEKDRVESKYAAEKARVESQYADAKARIDSQHAKRQREYRRRVGERDSALEMKRYFTAMTDRRSSVFLNTMAVLLLPGAYFAATALALLYKRIRHAPGKPGG